MRLIVFYPPLEFPMRRHHLLPLSVYRIALLAGVLIAASLAASCGQVPLSSLIGLRSFDLETTNPARLRIAVRHPDWIRVPLDGAVMRIEQRDKASGGLLLSERIIFQHSARGEDMASLAGERRRGSVIRVFRIAPADIERMRAVQKVIRERLQDKARMVEGSLSVSVTGCRLGAMPEGPVRVSTYLAAGELDGFLPLTRDFDLRAAMIDAGASQDDPIAICRHAPERN